MANWDWRVLLSRVRAREGKDPLSSFRILLIQHGLADLAELIAALIGVGADPRKITVIGIPYSSKPEIRGILETRFQGIEVHLPSVMPFDGYVAIALRDILIKCETDTQRLIVIEDGGYAVPLISQFKEMGIDVSRVAGAVEQTTRGMRIARRLELDNRLAVPVIAIPECFLKQDDKVEPPFIAAAVTRNLEQLRIMIPDHKRPETVGIVGVGPIGRNLARHFVVNGHTVLVADQDPTRLSSARITHGFGHLSEVNAAACDMIIGTTGFTSIGHHILSQLKNGVVLASASSRQIEIDIDWLDSMTRQRAVGPRGPVTMPIPAFRTLQRSDNGRVLHLLFDGFPVNFSGESLPDHVADLVLSLLFEAALAFGPGPGDPQHKSFGGTSLPPQVYNGSGILGEVELDIVGEAGWFQ